MFQPRIGTPPDLGSVTNFYVAILLITAPPFLPATQCLPGGITDHAPPLSPFLTVVSPHRIICPPGHHLYPSQHTHARHYLHKNKLPSCLSRLCLACRIPNAVPLPPSKFLPTSHSAAPELPFAATTAHGAFPLPWSPSTCIKPKLSAPMPPTPPLSPEACQCTSPVYMFLTT